MTLKPRPPNVIYIQAYASPELIRQDATHTSAADIWALGSVTHKMVTGPTPFSNPLALMEHGSGRASLPILRGHEKVSPKMQDIVRCLLIPEPDDLSSAEEAKEGLPWLKVVVARNNPKSNPPHNRIQAPSAMDYQLVDLKKELNSVIKEWDEFGEANMQARIAKEARKKLLKWRGSSRNAMNSKKPSQV